MKKVKNYRKFSDEYRLNENLLKRAWGKVVDYFKSKYKDGAWLYYAAFLKKSGQLPKEKVEIYIPSSIDIPTENDPKLALESLGVDKIEVSRVSDMTINEGQVSLQHANQSIRNIDVDELIEEITDIYDMNVDRVESGKERTKNDALFIWGAPGIGKTEILRQVADNLGCVVIEFHLATIDPTDFRGVPKIEDVVGKGRSEDERTVSKIPAVFPTDNGPNDKGGIMFFDELNRAKSVVLSAALPLCLGGRIGEYELPSKWIVVAAGNRPEDIGMGVTTIEPALANRFQHVNYAPTKDSWIKWAVKKDNINPSLIAFLNFNKQYFHKLMEDDETPNWASPRSWEQASSKEYFKRGKDWNKFLPTKKIQAIYTNYVGADAAVQFVNYLKLQEFYNEKDVADVYTKGAKAKKLPTKLDQSRAAQASIAFWKKGEKLTKKELENIAEFALDNIDNLESRTSFMSFMKVAHPEIKTEEPHKTIWWDALKKWHGGLKEITD